MVNVFSGDFNYNIPLLTVPGPNGGYPINLAYHAGIGMEQEASWVGLGWNINPGAVNRNLRGLPDDFKGDAIDREFNMKPNVTVAASMKASLIKKKERYGFSVSASNATVQIYYNNYRGTGYRLEFGGSAMRNERGGSDKEKNALSGNWGISFDSQSGMGFSPGLSYSKRIGDHVGSFNAGLNMHSRQGITGVTLSADLKEITRFTTPGANGLHIKREGVGNSVVGRGSGTSFARVP